jgi:hypothetical protein
MFPADEDAPLEPVDLPDEDFDDADLVADFDDADLLPEDELPAFDPDLLPEEELPDFEAEAFLLAVFAIIIFLD